MGKVDDGTTASDFEPDEVKRKISLSLALVPCEWDDHKINLIDTPGYADFVGEVKSGIAAADIGVVRRRRRLRRAGRHRAGMAATPTERSLPRVIFVNRMDRENANFEQALRAAAGALWQADRAAASCRSARRTASPASST